MIAYLDTSATVKLFLDDEGNGAIVSELLTMLGTATTSRLTCVETLAALAAARRAGRITSAIHAAAVADFIEIWAALEVVDLSDDVAWEAGAIAATFGLRAGDAIHLATAQRLRDPSTSIVSWDIGLRRAAMAAGMACYPPEI